MSIDRMRARAALRISRRMSEAAAGQRTSNVLGKARLAGFALAASGAALFSTKAIFIKLAYVENADAPQLLAWRMIFSLPFFLAVGVYALRRRRTMGVPS